MKTVLLVVAASAALGCSNGERGRSAFDTTRADTARNAAAASGQVQLKLPPGFTATVFAESLGSTRHIAGGPGGTIYANTWRSSQDTTRRVPPGGYLIACATPTPTAGPMISAASAAPVNPAARGAPASP